MNKEASAIRKTPGNFAPKLVDLTDNVLFAEVWERPELDRRGRSSTGAAAA